MEDQNQRGKGPLIFDATWSVTYSKEVKSELSVIDDLCVGNSPILFVIKIIFKQFIQAESCQELLVLFYSSFSPSAGCRPLVSSLCSWFASLTTLPPPVPRHVSEVGVSLYFTSSLHHETRDTYLRLVFRTCLTAAVHHFFFAPWDMRHETRIWGWCFAHFSPLLYVTSSLRHETVVLGWCFAHLSTLFFVDSVIFQEVSRNRAECFSARWLHCVNHCPVDWGVLN